MSLEYNEATIQDKLYRVVCNHGQTSMAIPNTYFFGWESDLITISKAGFIHEYEIKTSRADFLTESRAASGADWHSLKWQKHHAMNGLYDRFCLGKIPNYFSFVVVAGVCSLDEVKAINPKYGLITLNPYLQHEKKANRLTGDKPETMKAFRSIAFKYWSLRDKSPDMGRQ